MGMKTGWILGGFAAVLVVAGGYFLTRGPAASGPVTLFQWQDYMEPAFLADYQKTYNEKPAITIFADEDEAFSKMRAGFKPDVMGPCYYEFPRWKEAGLLAPIDTSKLKNWDKISPTQVAKLGHSVRPQIQRPGFGDGWGRRHRALHRPHGRGQCL
jgi:spermidine/putrescine-binding protein